MPASLEGYGPGSHAELGRRSGAHRSDMVRVLVELAERGLAERARLRGPGRDVVTISLRPETPEQAS